jgi:hypothetical protein
MKLLASYRSAAGKKAASAYERWAKLARAAAVAMALAHSAKVFERGDFSAGDKA